MEPIQNFAQLTAHLKQQNRRKRIAVVCANDPNTEYAITRALEEGIAEFYKSIHDEGYLSKLRMYGAFMENRLVGVIATRSEGAHIALFFVKGEYHGRGIGRKLFKTVLQMCPAGSMTVNSSPYAVPIYHHLGFHDMDKEQAVNGLRFTPMEWRRT